MKKITAILPVFLIIFSLPIKAEVIKYALFSIENEKRVLLSEGEREYKISDYVTNREERESKFYGVRKQLEISQGYSVGLVELEEHDLSGFGMWAGHLPVGSNPNDFSWEWFQRKSENLYTKSQGGSQIKITFIGLPFIHEISRIEFINDVELEYKKDICCKAPSDSPSNVLVIKAGSVLAFPPSAPNKSLKDAP